MAKKLTLKHKILIISILCSFIPTTILGFISFVNVHDLLLEKEEANLLSLGKHVEGILNNYYYDCNRDLRFLASMPEAKKLFSKGSFYSVSNYLLNFALYNPLYRQLTFVDLEGKEVIKIINDNYPSIVPRKELKSFNDFGEIKEINPSEEKVIFKPVQIDNYTDTQYRPNVRYATVVTDIFGQKAGYFILDVDVDPLLVELTSLQNKFPNIYLLDKEGVFYFRPQGKYLEQDYLKIINSLGSSMDSLKNIESYQVNITHDRLIAAYPLQVYPLKKTDMLFIIDIGRYKFMEPLKSFYISYFFSGLVLIVLLTTLGIYFSSIITKQLVKLAKAMDNVAVGDFNQQIKVNDFTEEEIRSLIVHFNNMIKKINAHYVSLEDKVEERTKELSKATEEMTRLAITDPLTGLYNRHFFQAYIKQQTEICKRYNKKLIIVIADIDNFKYINDYFGHNVGDKVLKVLADLLNASKRASDIAIRYGGDEFLVILMNDKEEAFLTWKKRLEAGLVQWNKKNNIIDCDLSLSIGYSIYNGEKDIETVIKEADTNMYLDKGEKKKSNKNS